MRRLVRQMKALGFGGHGHGMIAQVLLRNGYGVSKRSVGRFVRERPAEPPPTPVSPKPARRQTTVRGDRPNHRWLVDITRIPTLFPFVCLHMGAVLDACSRLPLQATLSLFEPSAAAMTKLLRQAITRHGRPRHLVTDQGAQFTSEEFKSLVRTLGIRPRFGAVGETHSFGLIDRFFRTLKSSLGVRAFRACTLPGFERRLEAALIHYAYVRPHSALGAQAPIEVYYGIRGHLPRLTTPPLGRAADTPPDIPFDVAFLDPENRGLLVFVPRAA